MAVPVRVPLSVAVTLKVIIVFGPDWLGGPAKLKQGEKFPVAGSGLPASALGNVNDAPTIASAQKLLRRCDRRRFRLNQQFAFIYISKRTGRQSSGQFSGTCETTTLVSQSYLFNGIGWSASQTTEPPR